MKYRGFQESEPYKRLKTLIVQSLKADPAFAEVRVEATWRASEGLAGLRCPDIQAQSKSLRIAFEVQLSTTFLDVVVGRREFYWSQGAALVWVLPWFDPNDRRMTTDDILFSNNSNILVVDHATTEASRAAKRFMMRCHYRVPQADYSEAATWDSLHIAWEDLVVDIKGQRVFAIDVEEEDRRLARERRERLAQEVQAKRAELRDKLICYVLDPESERAVWGEGQWDFIRGKFHSQYIELEGDWGPYG